MRHIFRILSVAAVLSAVAFVQADPLPIEQPGARSDDVSPFRGADQRHHPRRGVRKERRAVDQPAEHDEDAVPAPAPASMPTDLSAPPHLPDDRETSLV